MPEPRQIEEMALHHAALFKAEQARWFIECSLNLAATSMPMSALIRLLKDHIEILEEYG